MTMYDETPQHETTPTGGPSHEDELRERALRRLKKRRDFRAHLLMYVLFNAFFVIIWAMVTPDAFFWPVFPIVGWGIGVVANAYDVYLADEPTEQQIQREMEHLEHRG